MNRSEFNSNIQHNKMLDNITSHNHRQLSCSPFVCFLCVKTRIVFLIANPWRNWLKEIRDVQKALDTEALRLFHFKIWFTTPHRKTCQSLATILVPEAPNEQLSGPGKGSSWQWISRRDKCGPWQGHPDAKTNDLSQTLQSSAWL